MVMGAGIHTSAHPVTQGSAGPAVGWEGLAFCFSVKYFKELVLVSSSHLAGVCLAVLESQTLYVHTGNDAKCNLFSHFLQ